MLNEEPKSIKLKYGSKSLKYPLKPKQLKTEDFFSASSNSEHWNRKLEVLIGQIYITADEKVCFFILKLKQGSHETETILNMEQISTHHSWSNWKHKKAFFSPDTNNSNKTLPVLWKEKPVVNSGRKW